jgi:hypothetical protein
MSLGNKKKDKDTQGSSSGGEASANYMETFPYIYVEFWNIEFLETV